MACLLTLAGLGPRAVAQAGPLLNKPAPLFARNALDSRRVDLATLRGRTVLLNFWATWCGPCTVEMRRFVEWQSCTRRGTGDCPNSMDDDAAPVQSLLRKRKVNYPIVMGDEEMGLQYGGILGLPVTWLIDRDGIVRAHYKGEADLNRMETDVRKLLDSR